MMSFKITLLSLCILASCNYSQTEEKYNVYGGSCKIWLLHDERFLPIALCFNDDEYQDYSIKSNGKLVKRDSFVYSEPSLRGGRWEVNKKRLIINGHATPIQPLSSDTILLGAQKFLLNVTDKFKINNCNCQALDAAFKGGKIDSMKTLIMYK